MQTGRKDETGTAKNDNGLSSSQKTNSRLENLKGFVIREETQNLIT